MFCCNCGKELHDEAKFCHECGTPVQQINYTSAQLASPILQQKSIVSSKKMKVDTCAVIMKGISLIMLLSMVILPMFTLSYNRVSMSSQSGNYTINLLGDNYMAYNNEREAINSFSRITFIFMFVAIFSAIAFKIIQKSRVSLILSFFNMAFIVICDLFVSYTWTAGGTEYVEHFSSLGIGNIICLFGSISICVLIFMDCKKTKYQFKL